MHNVIRQKSLPISTVSISFPYFTVLQEHQLLFAKSAEIGSNTLETSLKTHLLKSEINQAP